MGMQIVAVVMGLISLILAQCTSIPQLIDLKKTRNSSGVSLITYIIYNITSIVWIVWSFTYYFNALAIEKELSVLFQWGLLPAIIMNVSNIFIMSYVLCIKISYMNQSKKLHITELELSKILLAKDLKKYSNDGRINNFKRYLGLILYLVFVFLLIVGMTVILCAYGYTKLPGAEKWTSWIMVINAIGAITWECVSWPQFIKTIREKDTTGISIGWAIFLPISCFVVFVYNLAMGLISGIDKFNYGIIFSLIFNGMIPSFGVLIFKIINLIKAKKMHLTEVEYTKKILLPLIKVKNKTKQKGK